MCGLGARVRFSVRRQRGRASRLLLARARALVFAVADSSRRPRTAWHGEAGNAGLVSRCGRGRGGWSERCCTAARALSSRPECNSSLIDDSAQCVCLCVRVCRREKAALPQRCCGRGFACLPRQHHSLICIYHVSEQSPRRCRGAFL